MMLIKYRFSNEKIFIYVQSLFLKSLPSSSINCYWCCYKCRMPEWAPTIDWTPGTIWDILCCVDKQNAETFCTLSRRYIVTLHDIEITRRTWRPVVQPAGGGGAGLQRVGVAEQRELLAPPLLVVILALLLLLLVLGLLSHDMLLLLLSLAGHGPGSPLRCLRCCLLLHHRACN